MNNGVKAHRISRQEALTCRRAAPVDLHSGCSNTNICIPNRNTVVMFCYCVCKCVHSGTVLSFYSDTYSWRMRHDMDDGDVKFNKQDPPRIRHDMDDGDVKYNKQDPEQHTSEPRKQASHTLICCRCPQVSKEKETVGSVRLNQTSLTLDGPFSPKGGRRSFCKR
jgi:hypothetical protein